MLSRFNGDHGHDTNECHQLKDDIDYFIHSGKLKKFKGKPDTPSGNLESQRQRSPPLETEYDKQRSPPLEPSAVDFTLDTICGGPHIAGNSNNARQRYVQTLRHEGGGSD